MSSEMLDIDIKERIDSCIGKNIHEIETNLNTLLDVLCPYVLQSYINSREVMQGAISQLDRINDDAVLFLMSKLLSRNCREMPKKVFDFPNKLIDKVTEIS